MYLPLVAPLRVLARRPTHTCDSFPSTYIHCARLLTTSPLADARPLRASPAVSHTAGDCAVAILLESFRCEEDPLQDNSRGYVQAASRLSTDCNSGFALLFVAGSVFLPFLYLEARTSAQEKLGLGLSWRHQAPTFPLPLPP